MPFSNSLLLKNDKFILKNIYLHATLLIACGGLAESGRRVRGAAEPSHFRLALLYFAVFFVEAVYDEE